MISKKSTSKCSWSEELGRQQRIEEEQWLEKDEQTLNIKRCPSKQTDIRCLIN